MQKSKWLLRDSFDIQSLLASFKKGTRGQTSKMQNVLLHIGHEHFDDNQVSGLSCSCRDANLKQIRLILLNLLIKKRILLNG